MWIFILTMRQCRIRLEVDALLMHLPTSATWGFLMIRWMKSSQATPLNISRDGREWKC